VRHFCLQEDRYKYQGNTHTTNRFRTDGSCLGGKLGKRYRPGGGRASHHKNAPPALFGAPPKAVMHSASDLIGDRIAHANRSLRGMRVPKLRPACKLPLSIIYKTPQTQSQCSTRLPQI
jgi:hypothetical protein